MPAANFAKGASREPSHPVMSRPGPAAKKRLEEANGEQAIKPPITIGSAMGDSACSKLLYGLAEYLDVKTPVDDKGNVDAGLLERLLTTAARALNLGPEERAALGRRPGDVSKRLRVRCRSKDEQEDPFLYDARINKTTGFRASQRAEAEAWLAAEIEIKRMEALGVIMPTQLPCSLVLDQMIADARPQTCGETETNNFSIFVRRVDALRGFYGDLRLYNVPGSEAKYYAHRRAMPGRDKQADGSFGCVADSTIRSDLEIFQTGLNTLTKFGCTWIPKLTIGKTKAPRATYLAGREATMLILGLHGWTWNYKKKDWNWRKIWDPLGRSIEWDNETGEVRVVRVNGGGPAMVKRPVIDFRYRQYAVHLRRMVIIGLYSGTRHRAIIRLRWARNGEGGWIDFARNVLHRADVRHGTTIKQQTPLHMPDALSRYLQAWAKLDGGTGYVIHKANGRRYETYLNQQFNLLVERAGLKDMEVSDEDRRFVDSEGKQIDIVFHVLRHTVATWLRERGVPLNVAADYLGVEPITLERVYGKWTLAGTLNGAMALNQIGWSPMRAANLPDDIEVVAIMPPILKAFPPE